MVALFNAISKHKRENAGDDGDNAEIVTKPVINKVENSSNDATGESRHEKQAMKKKELTTKDVSSSSNKGKWNALNDNYMLDKQLSLKV